MLLNAGHEGTEQDEHALAAAGSRMARSGPMRFGGFLAVALVIELVWAFSKGGESGVFAAGSTSSVATIGRLLFTEYSFAFEVTSVLILVAMVGAVVLARREEPQGRR
jgi:NADH-quinone oxidoreductase subunit J